ncbi:hypothetical protein, partial [Paenibacillus prosopidis]
VLRAATQYILILAGRSFFCKSNLLTPTGMLTDTIVEELAMQQFLFCFIEVTGRLVPICGIM